MRKEGVARGEGGDEGDDFLGISQVGSDERGRRLNRDHDYGKPLFRVAFSNKRSGSRLGDWRCLNPDCRFANYGRNCHCHVCRTRGIQSWAPDTKTREEQYEELRKEEEMYWEDKEFGIQVLRTCQDGER